MIDTIRVTMLGGLTVWIDDTAILDNVAKINKPWQVFCYLVLNRNAPASPGKLIATLWPDEALSDPGNVLKNTVYSLRREFKNFADKQNPVLFENGGYICNPDIHYETDVEEFERKCLAAKKAAESEERIQLLRQASDLYKGELLPQLESEIWVMPLSLYYKNLYSECVKNLCTELQKEERYSELLSAATAATTVDPLEEEYYIFIFRALYALGMHRSIIPTYHKTARLFMEELGTPLCDEIRAIYEASSERVDSIEQDIMIIKDDLQEVTHDSRPVSGPLYCTYDVFKYLYQMVARSSERTGSRVIIVLVTLMKEGGGLPPAKNLSAAMNFMKSSVLTALLRRSDTVARYSKSQYIIMLSVEKPGGAEAVMERIRKKSEASLRPGGISIVFAKTELDPI